jgi:hypothetical protein
LRVKWGAPGEDAGRLVFAPAGGAGE